MTIQEKIKLLIDKIKELQVEFVETVPVPLPEINTIYQFGDEDFLTPDKLDQFHLELESYYLNTREAIKSHKKGYEDFLQAWRKDDTKNAFVSKILHEPGSSPSRRLNKLYHPKVDYDKQVMPQVYSLLVQNDWDIEKVA